MEGVQKVHEPLRPDPDEKPVRGRKETIQNR